MSDAADRLAEAIRDLINEAIEAAVMKPSRQPAPRHEAPASKPEQISDEVRRIIAETYGEQPVASRRLLTVAEARERLGGIGPSMFYKLVSDGEIRTTKIGRRTFVAASVLDRFIESPT